MMHTQPIANDPRIARIANEIKQLRSNIICLQEVAFNMDGSSIWLQEIEGITGLKTVAINVNKNHQDRYLSGTAIMSSLPVIEAGTGYTPDDEGGYDSCYSVLETGTGRPVIVFSIHGAWGGHRENVRENQFIALNEHANDLETKYSDREPIILLNGDFNTTPDSSTMRFLQGKSSLHCSATYWTDAWDTVGKGAGYTSIPMTKLGAETALGNGIFFPQLLPERRIDYTMVKGWAYGKVGSPVSSELCFDAVDSNGYTVSDHYGITTDIWNPYTLPTNN